MKKVRRYFLIGGTGFRQFFSLFILFLILAELIYAPVTLNVCGELSSVGRMYELNTSVTTTGDCFNVVDSNIQLDCVGFNVTGDGDSLDNGLDSITTARSNITIRNCNFINFGRTINFELVNSSTIFNNSMQRGQYGVFLDSSNNNNITLNTISNVSVDGIEIFRSSNHNQIRNNTLYNISSVAINLVAPADNNTVYNNTVYWNRGNFVALWGANDSNVSYNTFYNNTMVTDNIDGLFISNYSYRNVISFNTIYNVTGAAISLEDSFDNNISSNTIYNYSLGGILINVSTGNRVYSNTIYNLFRTNSYGIYIRNASSVNHIYDHTILENNTYGIYLNFSNNTNISGNTIRSNTHSGIFIFDSSLSTNITSNTIFNNSVSGIYIESSNYTNITDNTLSNNSRYGLFIFNGSYNNVSFNTIYNNSEAGIFINGTRAEGNRFFENTIHNHTEGLAAGIYVNTTNLINHIYDHNLIQNNTFGIYLDYANYTNITNNNISRNTNTGLLLSFSDSVNVSNNTFFNNTRIGVNISNSDDTILINNIANYSQYGFNVIFANRANFTGNNATNSSNFQYYFDWNSNATFTGVNRALDHAVNISDIGIYGGSNITTRVGSTYNNFTTSLGTIFFDAATNVSMEVITLANSGATETGCTGFTGTCTLITPDDRVVNITNNDNSATVNLGMYYDSSDVSSSNLYIARYSGSGWNQTGQTSVDTTLRSVRYDGITSFSMFGLVNFVATPAAATTTTAADDSGGAVATTTETPSSSTAETTAAEESLPESTTVTVEVITPAAEEEVVTTEEVTTTEEEITTEESIIQETAPFQPVAAINVEQKIEGTDESESGRLIYGIQKGRIGNVDVEIPRVNLNLQIKKPKTILATLDLDLIPYMRHTLSLLFLLFLVLSLLTIRDASEYITEIPRGIPTRRYEMGEPSQRNVYITVNEWINGGYKKF